MFAQRTPKGAQRGRDLRDRDVSPIKPSPRAHSTNNSYYGNSIVPSGSGSGNVKVVCRVRPCNQKELDLGGSVAVNIEDEKTISVKSSQYNDIGGNGLNFAFDRIFDMESTQEEIYDFTARPVVESVLEGFNGTVFAYGQTSSGKTYTMMGPDLEDPEFSGIIPRMVSTVFDYISDTPDHIEFTVKVSMIEIYMERIRDLLNPKKVNLKIREDKSKGIYIEDVTESYVSDERDVYDFLKYGHNNRTTTTTNMNETSSRSHCLFMMTIHQNNLLEMHAKTGKLCLVDLAGSEKVAKTGAVGQVLEEAKEINKSLSALGNVINALTDSRGLMHIPYRDSKLTRILQESLGGNARTSLIINCSPSSYNENETISALRFGYRAKSIKNTPKINREYTAAQLQVLLEKAEKKIVIKDKRIKVLEEILYEHDIDVPGEVLNTEIQPSPNKRRDNSYMETEEGYDGLSDNESCIRADILSPFKNNKADQQEKIKALEDELRIERLSLQKQTDKVRLLKKDLDEANSRMFMVEKENEAFINKLAAQALKIQELQEKLRDKEMKLEILQLLKDILTTENEELKKSRKSFLNDLDEENKEVLKLAQTEGLLFTPRKGADQKGRNTGFITTEDFERRRDAYFGVIDNVTRDMIKEMTQKFSIRNLQTLKEVTIPYMDKLKLAFEGQEETPKKSKEGGSEIKKKYEKLKEELAHEKQKSSKNRHEYEAFLREHDYLDKSMVPSFDEWRQGIGLDSLREESDKDETLSFKDFSTKSAKEQKLALNLEHFKEKKKLSKLAEGNTELLSRLDKTPKGRRDHDEGEPKSPLKTQRMINLEKQLHETKELVNQYKNKIESLKSMISTNPGPSTGSPSSKLDSTEKIENTETFRLQKQNIKQEIVTQVTEKERVFEEGHGELSPKSSVKIVKPIKGGQMKKGSIASQKFFDILKQQYRFNRNFVNGISGESILSKQKQPEKGSKPQSEGKLKGV